MILEQVKLNEQATLALSHLVSGVGVKSNEDCVETINKLINGAILLSASERREEENARSAELNRRSNRPLSKQPSLLLLQYKALNEHLCEPLGELPF